MAVSLKRAALAGDWRVHILSYSSVVVVARQSQPLSSEAQLRTPLLTLKLLKQTERDS